MIQSTFYFITNCHICLCKCGLKNKFNGQKINFIKLWIHVTILGQIGDYKIS